MIKKIPGHYFSHTAEYENATYACTLPPGFDLGDLFHPVTWALHSRKFNVGDRIRVRSDDGSIDVMVVVDAVTVGGVHVSEWPKYMGATGGKALAEVAELAKERRLSVVPLDTDGLPKVRVQHLAATGWRVVGLNGEVARDLKSEANAIAKMNEYLKTAGLTMPDMTDVAPRGEGDAEAPKPARKSTKKSEEAA